MLVVVVIIAVLAGLAGGALIQARDHARRGKAETQLRELVKAWNQYYLVYSNVDWPPAMVLQVKNDGADVPMSTTALAPLFSANNTKTMTFLALDTSTLAPASDPAYSSYGAMYCDPWGNPYCITFGKGNAPQEVAMRISVSFPNRGRYR